MSFSPGDIVQLRSGGPAMTVMSEGSDGIHCIWYADSLDELKTAVVPAVCLELLILDDDDEDSLSPTVHGGH
jgi:uncharacterized protein YodC (DUF2158 family)